MRRFKVYSTMLALLIGVGAAAWAAQNGPPRIFLGLMNNGALAVTGGAKDQSHPGWIVATAVGKASTATTKATYGPRLGGTAPAAQTHGEITVTKPMDSSSPALFKALRSQKHFSEAVIDAIRATTTGKVYGARWTLEDVMIASIHNAAGGGATPMERVTLTYASIAKTTK